MQNMNTLIDAMNEAFLSRYDPSDNGDPINLVPPIGRPAWLLVARQDPIFDALRTYLSLPGELQEWVRRRRYPWLVEQQGERREKSALIDLEAFDYRANQ